MNREQENIQALRRILALKRHEQPPPGYFHRFSGQVIARIQAGERAPDSVWERFSFDAPWLRQLWAAFETKPLLAGAFGVTVCGLMATGFVLSDRSSNLQSAPLSLYGPNGNQPAIVQAAVPAATTPFGQVPGLEASATTSPDGVTDSLFQQVRPQQARLVKFTFSGGN